MLPTLFAALIITLVPAGSFSRTHHPTEISINGDQFLINGGETFLLGVSYFDVENWRLDDLDRFARLKFNLVRVWLDWSLMDGTNRSMFDRSSTISAAKQQRLRTFVRACAARGIVVDATVLQSDSSLAAPETAVRHAVRLLRDEPNVIFDLVNEHNNRPWSSSHLGMMATLVKAAREEGPGKIIFYSSWEPHLLSADPAVIQRPAFNDELQSGVMVLVPHLLRTPDWWAQTPSRVKTLKKYLSSLGKIMPLYLSEENRRRGTYINSSAEEFRTAAQNAKLAGAAGWIFHTEAGFDMAHEDFFQRLDSVEFNVMETLAAAVGR